MSFQPLPTITDDNEAFWGGGEHGELRITRCGDCRTWFHPPAPLCPYCLTSNIAPEIASGRATVATFTVNVQKWAADMEVPCVFAIVELDEQADVRLMTRLTNCAPEAVSIGMPVEVVFEQAANDVWLPLFRPAGFQSEGFQSDGASS